VELDLTDDTSSLDCQRLDCEGFMVSLLLAHRINRRRRK
jgi:hypothetical protein